MCREIARCAGRSGGIGVSWPDMRLLRPNRPSGNIRREEAGLLPIRDVEVPARRRHASAFIVQARQGIHRQPRRLVGLPPSRARGSAGDLLCDFVDLRWELAAWCDRLAANAGLTTLQLPEFRSPHMALAGCSQCAGDSPRDLLASLSRKHVVCDDHLSGAVQTMRHTLALLHDLQRRFAPEGATTPVASAQAFHGGDLVVAHPFKSAILHVLHRCGTLDVSHPTLARLNEEVAWCWLRTFTRRLHGSARRAAEKRLFAAHR